MSIISPLFAREFTKNAIYIAILSFRIVVCSLFPTKNTSRRNYVGWYRKGWVKFSGIFVHYFSYFLLGTSEKCRFVSLTTTPDRANRAIRLGMAMRPLRVSAMAQARSSFMVAPTKMTTRKRI